MSGRGRVSNGDFPGRAICVVAPLAKALRYAALLFLSSRVWLGGVIATRRSGFSKSPDSFAADSLAARYATGTAYDPSFLALV